MLRDVFVDMTQLFASYHAIQPCLTNDNEPLRERERLQSPTERERLDGLYECILCACCTAFCPSYW